MRKISKPLWPGCSICHNPSTPMLADGTQTKLKLRVHVLVARTRTSRQLHMFGIKTLSVTSQQLLDFITISGQRSSCFVLFNLVIMLIFSMNSNPLVSQTSTVSLLYFFLYASEQYKQASVFCLFYLFVPTTNRNEKTTTTTTINIKNNNNNNSSSS